MASTTTPVLALLTLMVALFLTSPVRVKAVFVAPLQRGRQLLRAQHAFSSSMQKLPTDVIQYSQVPKQGFFSADKIPRGLLKDHTTKAGTWGVIRVSEGKLEYTIQEPTPSVHEITPTTLGIIEPQVKHRVKALTDDLKFVVEFHRKPGTGPVNEKREGL